MDARDYINSFDPNKSFFSYIIKKAESEFISHSDLEFHAFNNKIDMILNQYSQEHGYTRVHYRFGLDIQPIWNPINNEDPLYTHKDDVYMVLNFLLPEKYLPLLKLLDILSPYNELAVRKLIALLLLRSYCEGNSNGMLLANDALDSTYEKLVPFTHHGFNLQEARKKGGKHCSRARKMEAIKLAEEIWKLEDELKASGKREQEITRIISIRKGKHRTTISRYRKMRTMGHSLK